MNIVALVGLALAIQSQPAGSPPDGQVIDAESGRGIASAVVSWIPAGASQPTGTIQSGPDGAFDLPAGWSGAGFVEVRAFGYRPLRIDAAQASARAWKLAVSPDPLELESLLLTANSRRRVDVTVPVLNVGAEEIAIAGAESVERLLADLPGLQAESGTPTGSNIMIRGIGGPRVLVLMDGQPISGALMENRDLSRLSLAGVERVEVVKGPLSSLHGSDALGGVINIITSDPKPGLQTTARALTGSQGRHEAEATISGGSSLLYRVTGGWRQQDLVAGLTSGSDAFSRIWDARSTVRWAGSRVSVRSDFSFLRERQRWPVGGGFSGFNDNRGFSGWSEVRTEGLGGTLMARVLGQHYEHLYRTARGNQPIAGGEQEEQRERLLEAALGYSLIAGRHSFDVGVEGATRYIRSPDKLLEDQASDNQLELFAQDDIRFGTATLSAGARWTLNDSWGNAISPTVGATLLVSDDLLLRASVGRGFRAPSFKELGWNFANLGAGYYVRGNPDLRAERSWNVSASAEWALSSAITLSGDVFQNDIEDLIDFSLSETTEDGLFVYSPRNISKARTRGFELGATARREWLSASASYAFLDARSLPDRVTLDRRVRHTGRVRVGVAPLRLDGARLDLTTSWTGKAPLVGTSDSGEPVQVGEQGDLLAVDAQVSIPIRGGLSIVAGGDNLFDQRPEGWPAVTGRRLRVGLEASDLLGGLRN